MKKKISEMENQFKEHRLTPQRRLILEVFLENRERHLSAEEVYDFSRNKGKDIGLATIYRTLELLVQLGLLRKIYFGDGRSRYELEKVDVNEQQHHHHHHLICLRCGKILEVEEDLLHQLEEITEKKHHFFIVNHNLQFYGYCSICRRENENKQ